MKSARLHEFAASRLHRRKAGGVVTSTEGESSTALVVHRAPNQRSLQGKISLTMPATDDQIFAMASNKQHDEIKNRIRISVKSNALHLSQMNIDILMPEVSEKNE